MRKSLFGVLGAGLIAVASLSLAPAAQAAEPAPVAAPLIAAAQPHVDFYRNNTAHTGYTDAPMPTPLSLLWRHTTVGVRGNPASPVSDNDIIYFGAGANVYAMRAADGTQVWKFPATGAASGNFETTPALSGGFLYVGGDDGQLYKLNAKTGASVWTRPVKLGSAIRSSPVIDSGVVYCGNGNNNCYAINADTGQILWTFPTQGAITSSPTVAGGQIAFASADNSVYSVNATTGKKLWSVRMPSDPSVSPPVYGNNTLYAGSGADLYALTARSGTVRWRTRLSSEVSTPVTLGVGTVFVVSQDKIVYAFNDRGQKLWTANIGYPTYAAPLLAGDVLLVPTQHGILYAFDAKTGGLRWEYVVEASGTDQQPKYQFTDIASAPIFVNKTLYVVSDDGTLSAFRANAPDSVPPVVTSMYPQPGSTVPGAHIFYGAILTDVGSGINPATVSLKVDGAAISQAKYDPSRTAVLADYTGIAAGQEPPPLPDGDHQATLTASDWRGNKVTQTWGFTVDNRFNPPGTAAPGTGAPPSPTPGATAPGSTLPGRVSPPGAPRTPPAAGAPGRTNPGSAPAPGRGGRPNPVSPPPTTAPSPPSPPGGSGGGPPPPPPI